MFLKIGEYQFAENSVNFEVSIAASKTKTGYRLGFVHRWAVSGHIDGTSASDISNKMDSLVSALEGVIGDVGFYDNQGALTHNKIVASSAINGIQIIGFKWVRGGSKQSGSGVEFLNRKSFVFHIEAEVYDPQSFVYAWRESVQSVGNGGNHWIMRTSLSSKPVAETTMRYTPVRVVQKGFSVGLSGYSSPATPLWDMEHSHQDLNVDEKLSPQKLGLSSNFLFPRRWIYYYEFPDLNAMSQLFIPTVPPIF